MPRITCSFSVVSNLDTLNTNLLICSGIVYQVGSASIRYDGPGGSLSSVVFCTPESAPLPGHLISAGAAPAPRTKLSRHVSVVQENDSVPMTMGDG